MPKQEDKFVFYRYERNEDRGRCLIATQDIQEGQLIFVERPLVALQSLGNIHDGVLVCQYCMSFCGTPQQALQVMVNPSCLQEITTNEATNEETTTTKFVDNINAHEHDLVPCRYKCGHIYCSYECQNDDWEWGGHKELCTGLIPDENDDDEQQQISLSSPLLQFKIHARETNEIFLLIAIWIIRIMKHDLPYYADNDMLNTHPYTDFQMNTWWDVKTKELLTADSSQNPGVFAEAIALENTLKQLCQESHLYLKAALPQENFQQSMWLTTSEGMARLIGSLEQNCLGIRRKHALQRSIMQDSELRHHMHREIIQCLEQAGMIGSEEQDEDDDDDSDDNRSVENKNQYGRCGSIPSETDKPNKTETKEDEKEIINVHCVDKRQNEGTSVDGASEEAEWDYTYDDIADFLADLTNPLKVDTEDEWDEFIRPLDGTAHFSIATKMNHSCEPNVVLLYRTRGWGKYYPLVAYCVALRDIKLGEELTISYINANDTYEKRQEALANYGFVCACSKCSKDLEGQGREQNNENKVDFNSLDENDLFGSDEDDIVDIAVEDNKGDQEVQHSAGYSSQKIHGEAKLAHVVEQIDSVLNKSIHMSITIPYHASASNYVVQIASVALNDLKGTAGNSSGDVHQLVGNCMQAMEERDFSASRIVGADLELLLFNKLVTLGSWSDPSFRMSYWCGAVTAAIGYAHEGSFLVAMKYLDKAMILGLKRIDLVDFISYVETFASHMASGPCPPGIHCRIPDFQSEELQNILSDKGLSKPIAFPVEEIHFDCNEWKSILGSQAIPKPIVLRNLGLEWPAVDKWRDLSILSRDFGYRLVPIEIGSMQTEMKEVIMTFRQFIESYLTLSAKENCWSLADVMSDNTCPIAYLAQHPFLDQVPALYEDVENNPCNVQPTNVNLWMGTGGTRTPLHYDSYDNLLVQLVGAKYVRLYSPEDSPKLYINRDKSYGLQGNMSELDCEMEDFEKHPIARECSYQEVLLLPGDCVFIPARHWHYVRSLSTSISVNYWF